MPPYASNLANNTPFDFEQVNFVVQRYTAGLPLLERVSAWPPEIAIETGVDTAPRPIGTLSPAASIATVFADQLRDFWPDAEVYYRCSERDKIIRLLVVGDKWDFDKEYAAFHLRSEIWPEALPGDWFIDVDVWFADKCSPDLTRYLPVL